MPPCPRLLVLILLHAALACAARAETGPTATRVLDIAEVPSAYPVGFCLLSSPDRQYAAYYDERKRMTVASRAPEGTEWTRQSLPSVIGWDSHNSITMALDSTGHLHVAGNMHGSPLTYFRTTRAGDVTSLERVPAMTGDREARCTYPVFLRDAHDRLVFTYRDGGSGNGDQWMNRYDTATRAWTRLLDRPLSDGGGRMSAYFTEPVRGPAGFFHLGWVWRDTPDCATNHDPSYARSRDLVSWETAAGQPIALPFTPETPGVVIDPVPAGGGIINGCLGLGFDSSAKLVATYHKFDAQGNTQAYAARFLDGAWAVTALTQWTHRWEFAGGGTIVFDVRLGRIETAGPGRLALPFRHVKHGSGRLLLDERTLAVTGTDQPAPTLPRAWSKVESTFPGMQVRWETDTGAWAGPRCVLRWETLPANRDRPREGELPPPSRLRLLELAD